MTMTMITTTTTITATVTDQFQKHIHRHQNGCNLMTLTQRRIGDIAHLLTLCFLWMRRLNWSVKIRLSL